MNDNLKDGFIRTSAKYSESSMGYSDLSAISSTCAVRESAQDPLALADQSILHLLKSTSADVITTSMVKPVIDYAAFPLTSAESISAGEPLMAVTVADVRQACQSVNLDRIIPSDDMSMMVLTMLDTNVIDVKEYWPSITIRPKNIVELERVVSRSSPTYVSVDAWMTNFFMVDLRRRIISAWSDSGLYPDVAANPNWNDDLNAVLLLYKNSFASKHSSAISSLVTDGNSISIDFTRYIVEMAINIRERIPMYSESISLDNSDGMTSIFWPSRYNDILVQDSTFGVVTDSSGAVERIDVIMTDSLLSLQTAFLDELPWDTMSSATMMNFTFDCQLSECLLYSVHSRAFQVGVADGTLNFRFTARCLTLAMKESSSTRELIWNAMHEFHSLPGITSMYISVFSPKGYTSCMLQNTNNTTGRSFIEESARTCGLYYSRALLMTLREMATANVLTVNYGALLSAVNKGDCSVELTAI